MLFPFHDENPTKRLPIVTVTVIALNLGALLYMGHLERTKGTRELRAFVHRFGFIPARTRQLVNPQQMRFDLFPEIDPRRIQLGVPRFLTLEPRKIEILGSLFSAMFLHAGWLHFLGNMWFFWLFGNNIEDRLGHFAFLVFYLLGGVIASGVHWAMSPQNALAQPVIGASGAVAVTLGAYAVTYPFARVRTLVFIIVFFTIIDLPALFVLGSWFVIQLLNGLAGPIPGHGNPVAWWAHIGGFVVGAIVMPMLVPPPGSSVADWEKHLSNADSGGNFGDRYGKF
jgi:membrane associated rhomboid family serine protease